MEECDETLSNIIKNEAGLLSTDILVKLRSNDIITMPLFLSLTDDEIKEINFSLGQRKTIKNIIEKYKKGGETTNNVNVSKKIATKLQKQPPPPSCHYYCQRYPDYLEPSYQKILDEFDLIALLRTKAPYKSSKQTNQGFILANKIINNVELTRSEKCYISRVICKNLIEDIYVGSHFLRKLRAKIVQTSPCLGTEFEWYCGFGEQGRQKSGYLRSTLVDLQKIAVRKRKLEESLKNRTSIQIDYPCPICGSLLSHNINSIESHFQREHDSIDKDSTNFFCITCDMNLSGFKRYCIHLEKEHNFQTDNLSTTK